MLYGIILLTLIVFIIIALLSLPILKIKNKTNSDRLKYNCISLYCVTTVIIYWFINLGWLRAIFGLPMLIHTIIMVLVINGVSKKIKESCSLMYIVKATYCTYIMAHIFLPDEMETNYVFFRLIHNDIVSTICLCISLILFTINIALIIMQIVLYKRAKNGI